MRILTIIAFALLLLSCKSAPQEAKPLPELLHSVTSDALTISYSDKCSDILASMDENSPFRSINYASLQYSPTILSSSYIGKLVRTLSISYDLGQEGVAAEILRSAQNHKLYTASFSLPGESKRGSDQFCLVISDSDAQISSVRRHFEESRSILDAKSFIQAAQSADGRAFTAYRCSASRRYIPKAFLSEIFTIRSMANFIDKVADWIVISDDDDKKVKQELSLIGGDNNFFYADMLAAIPLGDSYLGYVLPDSCSFALSMPIIPEISRSEYEHFLDANLKLNSYNKRVLALKAQCGKSPLIWEKESGIEELALIMRGEHKLLMLRTGAVDSELADNPYRGFVSALYGTAFAIEDDSCTANALGWTLIGSQRAIEEYLAAPKPLKKEPVWPHTKCHLIMRYSGKQLEWTKNGISLWNSGQ